MSSKENDQKQLSLPFGDVILDDNSSKVFSIEEHRKRIKSQSFISALGTDSNVEITKELERKILDEVLAEAEKLPWYK
jgi:hypothetical protein